MSRKLVYIFPGQASQYAGMGSDLYKNSAAAREVMDRLCLDDNLKQIPDLCFNGPAELLTRTDNVQPAITAVSLMALAAIREAAGSNQEVVTPVACAGHSLGEYSAHVAAGNMSDETAMRLVTWRGNWMNEASKPPNPAGAMVAVIGLSKELVLELVEKTGADRVGIANLNSPGQVILSGEKSAVEEAAEAARQSGAKRCVMLNVSGAWHSPLMNTAQVRMRELLNEEVTPEKAIISGSTFVVANATADIVQTIDEMRDTLARQITSPVRWEDCIRRLIDELGYVGLPSELDEAQLSESPPYPLFVEIGPGRVLKGLLRNIDRKLSVMNVESMAGVSELMEVVVKPNND